MLAQPEHSWYEPTVSSLPRASMRDITPQASQTQFSMSGAEPLIRKTGCMQCQACHVQLLLVGIWLQFGLSALAGL